MACAVDSWIIEFDEAERCRQGRVLISVRSLSSKQEMRRGPRVSKQFKNLGPPNKREL